MFRGRQFLTILTSESCSRAGVVQILATATSKSAPTPSVFNDFDFRIALGRRWCKFWRLQLPKVFRGRQFLTILTSGSCSRAGVVQILSHLGQQILRARPFLGADFPAGEATKLWKTQHFAQFLPAKSSCLTSLLYHICAITSLGFKIFSSNSQYNRKLDS